MKKIIFDKDINESKRYDSAGVEIDVGDTALLAIQTNVFAKVIVVKICAKTITVKHKLGVLPNGMRESWKGSSYFEAYYSREWHKNAIPTALYILEKHEKDNI